MTPAEKLATQKPRRKRFTTYAQRKRPWNCRAREVRNSLGLSIKSAAKACMMSVSSMWQVEIGCDLTLATARRIGEFYGKSVDELWPKLRLEDEHEPAR